MLFSWSLNCLTIAYGSFKVKGAFLASLKVTWPSCVSPIRFYPQITPNLHGLSGWDQFSKCWSRMIGDLKFQRKLGLSLSNEQWNKCWDKNRMFGILWIFKTHQENSQTQAQRSCFLIYCHLNIDNSQILSKAFHCLFQMCCFSVTKNMRVKCVLVVMF